MNLDTAVANEADEVNQAIHALKPKLLRMRLLGGLAVVGAVVLSIIGANLVGQNAAKPFEGVLISLGLGVFAIVATFQQIRLNHERLIMPILARTAGLTYQKGDSEFLHNLPERLLPRGRTRSDDVLSGVVGGRSIRFGEVKVETGGKNSRTLFDGLVISFPMQSDIPDFFLADQEATKGFLIFGGQIKVDDLDWQRSVPGHWGQAYALWARGALGDAQDRLVPLLNAISTIERNLERDSRLYTASCSNRTIHLAIRHRADLFRIGGLLSGEAELADDLRGALHELHLPLRLVTDLLQAEQAYAQRITAASESPAG
jgi:hypothetical protein